MSGHKALSAKSEFDAVETLHELGCTDGLPVIVPSPERVERMIQAVRNDPDELIGQLGPQLGNATVEKIATNAVMAGCAPEVFPIVLAAMRAACDPVLDMTEVQSTTHNLAPLLIINGPARKECSIAGGFGALGPGHRANATIGRALRLCMINIGGGRPGVSDMALLGHPGKFSYCLAEDEEASPFPPLHTSRGFSPEESTVTIVCVEAPHSVLTLLHSNDPTNADRVLGACAAALSNLASNNAQFGPRAPKSTQVLVLNPDHARLLAGHGYDRAKIQQTLHERAGNTVASLTTVLSGIEAPPDHFVPAVQSPHCVLVMVAGGAGLYSAVMPSWGGGSHGNVAVTKKIDW